MVRTASRLLELTGAVAYLALLLSGAGTLLFAHAAWAWLALTCLAIVIVAHCGRVYAEARETRDEPERPSRDLRRGLLFFSAVVLAPLFCLISVLLGLALAWMRGAPVLRGALTGLEFGLVVTLAIALISGAEQLLRRIARRA